MIQKRDDKRRYPTRQLVEETCRLLCEHSLGEKAKKYIKGQFLAIVFYQYNDRDNNFREFLKTAIQSKVANFGNFWEETRHFFK